MVCKHLLQHTIAITTLTPQRLFMDDESPRHDTALKVVQAYFSNLPDVNRILFWVCVGIFACQCMLGAKLDIAACISLSAVAHKFQIHRVLAAPFVHTGVVHLALNMLALLSLGPLQEQAMGSVRFGCCLSSLCAIEEVSTLYCIPL
jgi:membrane associated rhomboid family serine protease